MRHYSDCPFFRAATCAVGIECEHGYDVCPKCDPCTCKLRADDAWEILDVDLTAAWRGYLQPVPNAEVT